MLVLHIVNCIVKIIGQGMACKMHCSAEKLNNLSDKNNGGYIKRSIVVWEESSAQWRNFKRHSNHSFCPEDLTTVLILPLIIILLNNHIYLFVCGESIVSKNSFLLLTTIVRIISHKVTQGSCNYHHPLASRSSNHIRLSDGSL